MAYKNKEDQAVNARKHYLSNREKIISRAKEHKLATKAKTRELVRAAKSVPCADCGNTYHWICMDFDHIGSDKTKEVSKMVGSGCSVKTIQKEIDKCEVVCSNCHRIRTYTRSKSGD